MLSQLYRKRNSSQPHFSILKLSQLYRKRNSFQPHFSILKLSQLSRTISKNGVIVLADNVIVRITKLGVIVLADNEIKYMKTKKPRKPFDLRGRLTGRWIRSQLPSQSSLCYLRPLGIPWTSCREGLRLLRTAPPDENRFRFRFRMTRTRCFRVRGQN